MIKIVFSQFERTLLSKNKRFLIPEKGCSEDTDTSDEDFEIKLRLIKGAGTETQWTFENLTNYLKPLLKETNSSQV